MGIKISRYILTNIHTHIVYVCVRACTCASEQVFEYMYVMRACVCVCVCVLNGRALTYVNE